MFTSEHDLFRGPDFRIKRAGFLRSKGRYARRGRDDAYVIQAKKFLADYEKYVGTVGEERLAQKMPGIYYAYQIYSRSEGDDRWSLEARVLAQQTPEEIADRIGCSPQVVFWYEKLFFDVRDRLRHKDWVINRVLGPAVHRGIFERDYDLLLKLYALIGGPLVVDALVEGSSLDGGWVGSKREIKGFWAADGSDDLKRKAAIAVRCMPISIQTQVFILEAHHKLLEIEKETSAASGTEGLVLQNIQAALEAVPFHTSINRRPAKLVAAYDHGHAELRSEELMLAASGVNPVPGGLDVYRIPDVVTKETES